METQSEELSRLRAENACMKQLLTSKEAQLSTLQTGVSELQHEASWR
jgi:hypothetical protein